ncbi:ATP-binding cassette domain-containing protein [Candidatus Microgenomates bacterium]|nr:ATP-binding cassette domain-containing protein [Candidatus Microgenomates bacterium]
MENAIVVDKLSKNFEVTQREPGMSGAFASLINPKKKKVVAVKKISFSVQPGELVGFIGPNGAGKTTTLKMLSGLLYPTSGFVSVLDHDPWNKAHPFLKSISLVMGQKNQLWWDLPAMDTFELNREMYELKTLDYERNLEELVNLLDVGKLLSTPVRKLSLGQRMKMELIAALIHRPKVLFLDEPTIGLDLVAQKALRDFIYDYNKKYNATILLTSHNMNDLVDLARRVIVINDGQLIFDGALEQLTKNYAKEKLIKVTLSEEEGIEKIKSIGKIKSMSYPQVVLSVPRSTTAVAAAELLQNFAVSDLTIEETPVEEIIRKVFKKVK